MKSAVVCITICISVSMAVAQEPDALTAPPEQGASGTAEASPGSPVSDAAGSEAKADFWTDWPPLARKAAARIYDKYGNPDGVLPGQVVWENRGQWLRIAVFKDPVPHNFPLPHLDVLEQEIAYPVPAEKLSELARFNGSITASRTRGTLSVRGPSEAMNFLALNLAHEILTEATTVEAARRTCGEIVQQLSDGTAHPYLQDLQFRVAARGGTGDPDEAILPQPPAPTAPPLDAPTDNPADTTTVEPTEQDSPGSEG